jgi:hypothetical protein
MTKLSIKDSRATYYEASGKLSDISRQLAFAGIAIIWIFKIEASERLAIPEGLLFSAIAIIIFFAFDFCQYLSTTLIWGYFTRKKEKEIFEQGAEDKFLVPSWYPKVPMAFFAGKLFAISLTYIAILIFLVARIDFA